MIPLPLLASFEPERIGIFIPIIGITFGCVIALVAIIGNSRSLRRREELWHETARVALEKGQPLPPRMDADTAKVGAQPNTLRRQRNDLRSGLILLAAGGGLFLALGGIGDRSAYFGAIPGFIGVALLVNAAIEGLGRGSKGDSANPPQKP